MSGGVGPRPRVGVMMRVDALSKPGGDTVQMQACLAQGRALGLFDGEICCDPGADPSGWDVVHLTNIDRPVDTLEAYRRARHAGRPVVLSTIHHAYADIERYERLGRQAAGSWFLGRLDFQQLELLRSVVRGLRQPALRGPTWRAARQGLRQAQAEMVAGADCVLTLTDKELRDLETDFGVQPRRHAVVANGCDFEPPAGPAPERDIDCLVVGRIEARKNTLAILECLEALGVSGVFVGGLNPHHRAYGERFLARIGNSRSRYLGPQDRARTAELFRRARVHVSASWFEVASLVDLEAAMSGCRVVASVCGGSHERLGDRAWYCRPDDPASIDRAVRAARAAAAVAAADPAGLDVPRWDAAARGLHAAYRQVLEGA